MMHILRAGEQYFNMDNVTCVQTDARGCIYVNFVDGSERVLRSPDAGHVIEYMERNADNIEYCPDSL